MIYGIPFHPSFTTTRVISSFPDDFVLEVLGSKDFIQNKLHIMANIWSHVHINTPILRQQLAHQHQALVHHLEVGIKPAAPGVAVGFLLDDGRLFHELNGRATARPYIVPHAHAEGKVLAGGKGRVNVDQVDLAGKARQERGHHHLVVAPDEHVAPRIVAGHQGEEIALDFLPVSLGLVHRFDYLKGQDGALNRAQGALVVVLPDPDQFSTRNAFHQTRGPHLSCERAAGAFVSSRPTCKRCASGGKVYTPWVRSLARLTNSSVAPLSADWQVSQAHSSKTHGSLLLLSVRLPSLQSP